MGEVNYGEEFEKLTKSVVTMAGGLAKVFTGFGLKVIDKEEKEERAAAEKKAVEQKMVEEERLVAEERMIAVKFGPGAVEKWKKEKEEEDTKKKEEEKKERRLAFLLSVPGQLINVSTVLEGVREIGYCGKDTALVLGRIIKGIPSLVRRYHNAPTLGSGASAMGTGSLGVRIALNRHVLTRSYNTRLEVIDAFGTRKETIPRLMGGSLVITTKEELYKAIADFRQGKLSQILDIDPERLNLKTVHDLWCSLCNEELTGLLSQKSALPELALRASALIQEEKAVRAYLKDAEEAVKGLQSCVDVLEHKLGRSVGHKESR